MESFTDGAENVEATHDPIKVINETKPIKRRYACVDDFLNIEIIGYGGFGIVSKVKRRKDGKHLAMKQMLKARVMYKGQQSKIANEYKIPLLVNSSFVPKVHHAF